MIVWDGEPNEEVADKTDLWDNRDKTIREVQEKKVSKIISVRILVEDINNLSDQAAVDTVVELINEAFGREASKENPRCKVILILAEHGKGKRDSDND